MTGDEGSDGAYYSVIEVPEGIYNILSGIEGDTIGDSKKTGREDQHPPHWIKLTLFRQSRREQVWLGPETLVCVSVRPAAGTTASLPASVEGTAEAQSTAARFVVSGRAEAVDKAAVGEGRLHRNREEEGLLRATAVQEAESRPI